MLPYIPSDFQEEIEHYEQLRDYLAGGIEDWIMRFVGDSHGGHFKDPSLYYLLEEFRFFGREYFDEVKTLLEKRTKSYPDDWRRIIRRDMYRVIHNLQSEWDTINRACNQRENTLYRHKIKEANKWVAEYYSRYNGYKVEIFGNVITPIIYFGKLYRITRYPFTPYPLISIPIHSSSPIVWQGGFVHELGHHLFWNSTPISNIENASNVRKKLEDAVSTALVDFGKSHRPELTEKQIEYLQSIWSNWFEETFADIVGTLLIGPQFLHSGLRLIDERSSSIEELVADDLEHAIPVIRPFISLRTMANIPGFEGTQEFAFLQEECQDRIRSLLKETHKGIEGDPDSSEGEFASVELLRDTIDFVVRSIVYGAWLNQDGVEVELISLFNVSTWLAVETSMGMEMPTLGDVPIWEEIPRLSQSDSFRIYMDTLSGSRDEIYEELLKLDLGKDDQYQTMWGKFKNTGGGTWEPCY